MSGPADQNAAILQRLAAAPRMDLTSTFRSVLYKGHSGTGKTHNMLSWPEPITLLYAENNTETVKKLAAKGVKVDVITIDNWNDFMNLYVPAIANGMYQSATIGIDSLDFIAHLMWEDIRGSKATLSIQDYGIGLRRMIDVLNQITSATARYNIVMTTHLKEVKDEDSGKMIKMAPNVVGQFANIVEDYFDYVLLCESGLGHDNVNGTMVPVKEFKCYSVAPAPYHTCKGGDLPAVGGGTFAELSPYFPKAPSESATPSTE